MAIGLTGYHLGARQSEEQYYRGLYDVCAAQTGQRDMCLNAVATFRDKDWYELESPGYEWPLPNAPARTPRIPGQAG